MSDAEFVRKAEAVMRAAGVEDISIGYLFQHAPAVFLAAFKSIYQVEAPNASRSSSLNEHKVEFVISELWRRTGFHILEKVTAKMVCQQKDFRAVGVIVGILYEEGQRLWKVRMEEMYSAPPKHMSSSHRSLKKSDDKRRGDGGMGCMGMTSTGELAEAKSMNVVESFNTLETVYMGRMDELIPGKEDGDGSIKAGSSAPASKKKKRRNRIPGEKSKKEREKEKENLLRDERRKEAKASASGVYRTYEVGRDAAGRVVRPDAVGATLASSPNKPKTQEIIPTDYTYDMLSGRKIPIEQARRQREKADAAQSSNGEGGLNAGQIRTLYLAKRVREKEEANKPPAGPTQPQWPGQRTGMSTELWVKKMNKVRTANVPDPDAKNVSNIRCVELPAYAALQQRDVLISVEHCHSCAMHNSTLRHDEDGYASSADTFLQFLGRVCHTSNKMIRVGLCRFKSKVTCKKDEKADCLRIGAFEIQVALRQDDGKLVKETLHSKCISGRWPGKQVLEKRLLTLLSKAILPDQPIFEPSSSEFFNCTFNDGLQEYPCGVGPWQNVSCAVPGWRYPDKMASVKSAGITVPTLSKDVAWIYDARRIGSLVWVKACSSRDDDGELETHTFETPLLGIIINYHAQQNCYDVSLKYMDRTVSMDADQGAAAASNEKVTFIESITASNPRGTRNSMPPALQTILAFALRRRMTGAGFWASVGDDNDDCNLDEGRCFITRRTLFLKLHGLISALKDSKEEHGAVFFDDKTKSHRMKSRSRVVRRVQFVDVEEARSEAMLDYVMTHFLVRDGDGNPRGLVDAASMEQAANEQDEEYDRDADEDTSMSMYAGSPAPNSPNRRSVEVEAETEAETEIEAEAEEEKEEEEKEKEEEEEGEEQEEEEEEEEADLPISAPTPSSTEPETDASVSAASAPEPIRQSVRESVDHYGDDTFILESDDEKSVEAELESEAEKYENDEDFHEDEPSTTKGSAAESSDKAGDNKAAGDDDDGLYDAVFDY
jgi:hypothetical protein